MKYGMSLNQAQPKDFIAFHRLCPMKEKKNRVKARKKLQNTIYSGIIVS